MSSGAVECLINPHEQKLSKDEIESLLRNNRNDIIDNVVREIKKTAKDIGESHYGIWLVNLEGSYLEPDPNGRWPRIVLPQYPDVYSPDVQFNRRGEYVYGASDIDIEVVLDRAFPPQVEPYVGTAIKRFEKSTGVRVHSGIWVTSESDEEKLQYKSNYRVLYRREDSKRMSCQDMLIGPRLS